MLLAVGNVHYRECHYDLLRRTLPLWTRVVARRYIDQGTAWLCGKMNALSISRAVFRTIVGESIEEQEQIFEDEE